MNTRRIDTSMDPDRRGRQTPAGVGGSTPVSRLTNCKRVFGLGITASWWRLGLVILAMAVIALLIALL